MASNTRLAVALPVPGALMLRSVRCLRQEKDKTLFESCARTFAITSDDVVAQCMIDSCGRRDYVSVLPSLSR